MENRFKKSNLITLAALFTVPFITGTIFIFFQSPICPIVAFISFLVSTLVFKGRYRIYSFLFHIPLTSFFALKIGDYSIGSLLTLMVFIYFVEVCIESIVQYRKNKTAINFRSFLPLILLIIIGGISNLINIQSVSLIKYCSVVLYWLLPLLLFCDKRGEKEPFRLIVFLSISFLLINLYCFLFIYVFKSVNKQFVNIYLPDVYSKYLDIINLQNFRFPGMVGDSNHNSLFIIIISSVLLLYLYKYRKHYYPLLIMTICLQPFGLIGGSKTYIVGLIVLLFSFVILFFKNSSSFPVILASSTGLILMSAIVILSIPSLSKSITRLLLIDDRVGFLEAFTTYRASIWGEYFSRLFENPFKLLFGHGIQAKRLFGADYHNSFVELIWEYGVLGIVAWFNYFKFFFPRKTALSRTANFIVLLILIIFGFSLHIIYDEILYATLLVYATIILAKTEANEMVKELDIYCEVSI